MEKIGVFVCHCGTNIAGTVDVAKVAEELGKVNGVVFSTNYTYMCSSAGQKMIEDHIKDDKLTGVVLCSCSPRMPVAAAVGSCPDKRYVLKDRPAYREPEAECLVPAGHIAADFFFDR